VDVSSDASLTLKGLHPSVSFIPPLFYIVFPRDVRLHAPGFYNGESTVDIRVKLTRSYEAQRLY
jgi:hypothetical protein